VAYGIAMLGWVWILDRQVFFGEPSDDLYVAIGLAIVHVAVGFVVARWWILLLPFVFVFVSIPLGTPTTNSGEPFPIWWSLLAVTPLAIALLASGVGLRSLGRRLGGLGVR
jgi:hypothetical protein